MDFCESYFCFRNGISPVVLAGGLTPENVGEAIRQVHPFAVDLNSGVEFAPGCKDLDKVRAAIAQVAAADAAALLQIFPKLPVI